MQVSHEVWQAHLAQFPFLSSPDLYSVTFLLLLPQDENEVELAELGVPDLLADRGIRVVQLHLETLCLKLLIDTLAIVQVLL